jgi:6-pyruvoyl-tetrahydropterin synthase
MFTLTVRDHVMIAHSLRGAVFGPAERLHGATYVVDVEVAAAALDKDGVVMDIGLLARLVGQALEPWRYRNLDEVPGLAGLNTTTEVLARKLWEVLREAIYAQRGAGHLGQLPTSLKVTLLESHVAWAAYSAAI